MKYIFKLYTKDGSDKPKVQETWTLTDGITAESVETILNGLEFADEQMTKLDGPEENESCPVVVPSQ